jgi:hypothetical protein
MPISARTEARADEETGSIFIKKDPADMQPSQIYEILIENPNMITYYTNI